MVFIVVKMQEEGIHCYPDAPSEVSYLSCAHRHMFHVELEIEVFDDDRELEFIMVKHKMQKHLNALFNPHSNSIPWLPNKLSHRFMNGTFSCEMVARALQYLCKEHFPHQPQRKVNVKVFEDGENGVYLVDKD